MTSTERNEVREMIHGIMSGWHATITAQNDITNVSLKNIEDHFKRLNGSVAEHAKVIAENLPHTVLHCSQAEDIQMLKDVLTGDEAVEKERKREKDEKRAKRKSTMTLITVIIGALALTVTAYYGYISNMNEGVILNKQDNLGIPLIVNKRGEILALPDSTRILYFPNDSLHYVIKRVE